MVSGVTGSSVPLRDAATGPSVYSGAGGTSSAQAAILNSGASSTSLPNPQVQFNPGLNLVVMEFRSSSGEIVSSIPSQSQLTAYQLNLSPTNASSGATY
jgi:hypothetical protein